MPGNRPAPPALIETALVQFVTATRCALGIGNTSRPAAVGGNKVYPGFGPTMIHCAPMPLMLAYDPSTNPLNNNDWAFPLLEIIHITGFAVAIGTVAIVDLCLLGGGQGRWAPARMVKDTGPLTLVG